MHYTNENYFNSVAEHKLVDIAIYDLCVQERVWSEKFKQIREEFYNERLRKLHKDRRNKKELLFDTAKRVFAMFV
jgi:hypothetical protein